MSSPPTTDSVGMAQITSITLPIFLIIALGLVSVRGGYLVRDDMRVLGQFVLRIAVPALVFNALTARTGTAAFSPTYFFSYLCGSLASFVLMLAFARLGARPRDLAALEAMGASMSNSGYIGYPVALLVIGPAAASYLVQNMVIENTLMLSLALALAESASQGGQGWQAAVIGSLGRVVRNPIIVAIGLGVVVSLLGVSVPTAISHAVGMMASAAAPIALFVVGGSLAGLHVYGMKRDVSIVTAAKLVVHPAMVVLALTLAFRAPAEEVAAGMIFAAVPMLSIYPVFGERYHYREFCSATLLTTTIASFVTLSLVLWIVHHWLGIAP